MCKYDINNTVTMQSNKITITKRTIFFASVHFHLVVLH